MKDDLMRQPAPRIAPKLWFAMIVCAIAWLPQTQVDAQLFSKKPKFLKLFEQKPSAPVRYQQIPSQQQLIADINAVATRIRQVDSRVTVAVPGSPKINGKLQVEFPNRMRLKAGIMGMSEVGVDAGSNDQLFWVWTKVSAPGQPATMYYAKHEAFQNSQLKQQLPFEPKWLINAMGVIRVDPQGTNYGPYSDKQGRMHLYSTLNDAGGKQITRALLINQASGIIEQVAIYNQQGKLVAWSNASDFHYDTEYNVSLPGKISLQMVQADGNPFQMTISLKSNEINSLHGDPKLMWEMPNATGVQWVNLGQ